MTASQSTLARPGPLRITFKAIALLMVIFLLFVLVSMAWLVLSFKPEVKVAHEAYLYGYNNNKLPLSDNQRYSAAKRFLPYALMADHAYCVKSNANPKDKNLRSVKRELIREELEGWELYEGILSSGEECPSGFYSEVWKKNSGNAKTQLAIVFRGTTDLCDWATNIVQPIKNGKIMEIRNIGAFLYKGVIEKLLWGESKSGDAASVRPKDSDSCLAHYEKAVARVRAVAEEFVPRGPGPEPDIVTVGHSLGGGMAEYALYSLPEVVQQAIGFNPSPVTGYSHVHNDNKVKACRCAFNNALKAPSEPRVYRLYESGEVLAHARGIKNGINKVAELFGLSHISGASNVRFIHEVELDYMQSPMSDQLRAHSIETFQMSMKEDSAKAGEIVVPWYEGEGSKKFMKAHEENCRIDVNTVCNL